MARGSSCVGVALDGLAAAQALAEEMGEDAVERLVGGDGKVFGAEFLADVAGGIAVLGEAAEVVTSGGGGVDEEVLLGFSIVKDEGFVEVEINLARVEHAKDDDLVTGGG